MGKNNSFGKLLAFTTTVAAIGGVCYIFRDQIKESSIYKKASEKFFDLRDKMNDKFSNDEDDFFFDDDFEDDFEDDIFTEDGKKDREYTSITINAKEDDSPMSDITQEVTEEPTEEIQDEVQDVPEDIIDSAEELKETVEDMKESAEDMKEIFADTSIPTISFGNNQADQEDETSATEEVVGYENEGLSDVSEDPDVLADMDRLDF